MNFPALNIRTGQNPDQYVWKLEVNSATWHPAPPSVLVSAFPSESIPLE
jgi:hypothetical protein